MHHPYLEFAPAVAKAQKLQQPILALESTIFTHGLPTSQSFSTAMLLEEIAREYQVTPAIIAIMNGKIKIGLTHDELTTLLTDPHRTKASTRDLAYILGTNSNAGTTVAATLFCAAAANIRVFATGGIGGVHRGDAQDISADLLQLSRSNLVLVCAGAKAILDIPKTLELLETLSVPVIGFNTATFPAFYSRESTHPLTMQASTVEELAHFIKLHWQLDLPSGLLVANPIPKTDEIPATIIEPMIETAIASANAQKICGKELTPFLLAHIAKATGGKSTAANMKLVANNVRVGAQLAKAINMTMNRMAS